MPSFQNARIATKISLLLVLLSAVAIAIAALGSMRLQSMSSSYSKLTEVELPSTLHMARINRHVVEMAYAGYRALTYDGASQEARDTVAGLDAAHQGAMDQLDKTEAAMPGAESTAMTRTNMERVYALAKEAVTLGVANRNDEARAVLARLDPLVQQFSKESIAVNESRIADATKMDRDLKNGAAATSTMMLVIGVVGSVLSVAIGIYAATVAITRPLGRLNDAMRALAGGDSQVELAGQERGDEIGAMARTLVVFRDASRALDDAQRERADAEALQREVVDTVGTNLANLAAGDLTRTITQDFPAGFAALKANFNAASESLKALIGGVVTGTSAISTGSTEIASASEDLARRTEGTAASLEQTSAAINQMNERLRATAEAAARTVLRADGAIESVSGGRSVADQAMQAMGRVSDSAKGIDNVIEGLDKIAFQTRVLAMNAAVEAGRAGQAGRGFAVVADLVSALAMRAEEEAKRARDQLTVTQSEIKTAVDAVRNVDGALANISGDVGEVHALLGSMAADNQAQASAITQISAAVTSMDRTTQQNAAMVEQTSAAARNLTSEVSLLTEHASRFQIGSTGPSYRSGPKTAPAPAAVSQPAHPVAPSLPAALPPKARNLPPPPASDTAAAADWASF